MLDHVQLVWRLYVSLVGHCAGPGGRCARAHPARHGLAPSRSRHSVRRSWPILVVSRQTPVHAPVLYPLDIRSVSLIKYNIHYTYIHTCMHAHTHTPDICCILSYISSYFLSAPEVSILFTTIIAGLSKSSLLYNSSSYI